MRNRMNRPTTPEDGEELERVLEKLRRSSRGDVADRPGLVRADRSKEVAR